MKRLFLISFVTILSSSFLNLNAMDTAQLRPETPMPVRHARVVESDLNIQLKKHEKTYQKHCTDHLVLGRHMITLPVWNATARSFNSVVPDGGVVTYHPINIPGLDQKRLEELNRLAFENARREKLAW